MGIDMFTNRHKYFRWTGRTAAITFVFGAFIPSILGYFAYTTEVRTSIRCLDSEVGRQKLIWE